MWRIVADHDDTTIVLRSASEETIELDAGEVHDLVRRWSFVAESDEPFGLVQLMSGAEVGVAPGGELDTCDCGPLTNPGDPAMRWVPLRRSWVREHLVDLNLSASEAWCGDQLTIVAATEDWDAVRLDGARLPAGTELADGGLSFVYVPLNTGLHTVTSPPEVGVEVTAYGYAERGGYVVPGASGLQPRWPSTGPPAISDRLAARTRRSVSCAKRRGARRGRRTRARRIRLPRTRSR